jgi:glycerol-1-phosphate dehydrogenase [NAD(P)+]
MARLLTGWLAKFFGLNFTTGKSFSLRVIGAPAVFYGDHVLPNVGKICEQEFLNLENVYVIAGDKTYKVAGKIIADALKSKYSVQVIKKSFDGLLDTHIINDFSKKIENPTLLIGVGGGSKMDLTKMLATKHKVPYVLVPTALSHDGLASNYASSKEGTHRTKRAELVLADHTLLKNADEKFTKAGFGDILSNYSAAYDWTIAKNKFGAEATNYSRKIEFASWLSAQAVMEVSLLPSIKHVKDMIEELILGIVVSATAMNSANSSIPCSGSEHTVEKIVGKQTKELHGTICASLALPLIYMQPNHLQSGDWKLYRKSLLKMKLPATAKDLGLDKDIVLEGFEKALSFRSPKSGEKFNYQKHRYGILNKTYDKLKKKEKYMKIVEKAMHKTKFI